MPNVARANAVDLVRIVHPTCQNHTETKSGSPNVFVNGIPIHRYGDSNQPHTIKRGSSCPLHQTIISSASKTVFTNGRGVARIDDVYSCGAKVMTGSSNVFAGG